MNIKVTSTAAAILTKRGMGGEYVCLRDLLLKFYRDYQENESPAIKEYIDQLVGQLETLQ